MQLIEVAVSKEYFVIPIVHTVYTVACPEEFFAQVAPAREIIHGVPCLCAVVVLFHNGGIGDVDTAHLRLWFNWGNVVFFVAAHSHHGDGCQQQGCDNVMFQLFYSFNGVK